MKAFTILLLLTVHFGYSQSYSKWLALEINHSYFTNGAAPIKLVPTQKTNELLKSNNILVRQADGLCEFYIGLPSTDIGITSELENLGILKFKMVIEDPLFLNYTNFAFPDSGEYFLFRNTPNNANIQMDKVNYEEPEDQIDRNSLGILQINVNELQTKKLTLSFEARKVFYQYQVIIADKPNFEINEIKVYGFEQEEYAGPIEKTIINGQTALVFTSTSALPLFQSLVVPPVLKLHYTNGSSNTKELEIRLPNPSPENFRINENGHHTCVTIVYI